MKMTGNRTLHFAFILVCLFSLFFGASRSQDPYDLVITGARIVDGSGNPWFYGDLAVQGDRIARITPRGGLSDAPAGERIDAHGLVLAPGFIDIQSQSRHALLRGDGRVISKVTQGVTSEIMGEGISNAPSDDFPGPHGFDHWLEAMKTHGASVNFGSFLGAATVRETVMGLSQGQPDEAQIEQMRQIVVNAMKDGAFGIASALIYPPGSFAGTGELIEMARAMAPYHGLYISHIRSEGDHLMQALDEALEIGRGAQVPVEIFHLKEAGRRNWSKARAVIARITAARREGQDVGADMYPYRAGATGLTACLPPWASADGKLLDNLGDPVMRQKIRQAMLHPQTEWENLCDLATPQGVMVLDLKKPANHKYAGKRLSEISASMGKDWIDTIFDLVLSEKQRISTIYFIISEDNLKLQLKQPWIKIGTDAGGVDPQSATVLVHPRSYGTYPRILSRYVRDEPLLTLEEAVRKMTSAVAERLGIRDRGFLREGMRADLVLFDPDRIRDRATYENPHQISVGIRDVWVNGELVVQDGEHTGALPGSILRGPGYQPQAVE